MWGYVLEIPLNKIGQVTKKKITNRRFFVKKLISKTLKINTTLNCT